MIKKLCHREVFYPVGVDSLAFALQKGIKDYQLSEHIITHIKSKGDKKHKYMGDALRKCIMSLSTEPRKPFEVELAAGNEFKLPGWFILKYCVRVPYDKDNDVVIVIRPGFNFEKHCYDGKSNKVVTAWINKKTDNHYTLDEDKYCKEQEWVKLNYARAKNQNQVK